MAGYAAVPPSSHPSGRLSLSPRSQAPTQRPANRRSRLVSAHPSRRSDSALPNRPPFSSAPACAYAQASLPPPSPLPRRFLFPRGLGRQRGSRRRRRAACGQAPHCPLLKVSARLWAAARAVLRHRRCRGRAEPASSWLNPSAHNSDGKLLTKPPTPPPPPTPAPPCPCLRPRAACVSSTARTVRGGAPPPMPRR